MNCSYVARLVASPVLRFLHRQVDAQEIPARKKRYKCQSRSATALFEVQAKNIHQGDE